ncbi:MAG: cyanophycin synthetase [Acholeplasma sp.]|nr:cyanophycin synthetase [Acholeplasma sp.]
MSFKSIDDAVNWLEYQPRFKERESLDLLEKIFNSFNISFLNTKKIHVLGTNGKGSVVAFVTSVLVGNNLKVGTFVSPYLVKFNERIKLNNIDISDSILLHYINKFYDIQEQIFNDFSYRLSFFEILTMISLMYFSDENVDVIVMEAGIGGRLDATNILEYDATVITSIGFDHMDKLGNTLLEIGNEKLQALKPGGLLISAVEGDLKIFYINYANKIKAKHTFVKKRDIFAISPYSFYYKDLFFELKMLGDYQRLNAVLAYLTIKSIFNLSDNMILPYLKNTFWPGRFEEVKKDIFIDGAHNISAMTELMKNINYIFKDKKIIVLFSALKDKKIKEMLEIISEYGYEVILTSFPELRFQSLKSFGNEKTKYIENGYQVFKEIVNKKETNEVIIVTGSLHFIGYIKQNILKDVF